MNKNNNKKQQSLNPLFFQDMIMILKNYWSNQGCAIIESYDQHVGAGTLAPYTALNINDDKQLRFCQVQYCRRPTDGRFGDSPNRSSAYYQMQIILKPAPEDIQLMCLNSFEEIGISKKDHDIKFMEDDWENPSIGASGLGYEVWCDGMEIAQFTYMQKIGGINIDKKNVAGEITYGLERLAMYVQNKDNYLDIDWNKQVKYSDIHPKKIEKEECDYYKYYQKDTDFLKKLFDFSLENAKSLIEQNIKRVAYEQCLTASHILNILDARNELSQVLRKEWILKIREIVKLIISN